MKSDIVEELKSDQYQHIIFLKKIQKILWINLGNVSATFVFMRDIYKEESIPDDENTV